MIDIRWELRKVKLVISSLSGREKKIYDNFLLDSLGRSIINPVMDYLVDYGYETDRISAFNGTYGYWGKAGIRGLEIKYRLRIYLKSSYAFY